MKEDDIMVTRQDLNRIIVEKVKQSNHDMRETTVVIQGGEVIQKDGKATTKKPNKPFHKPRDLLFGFRRLILRIFRNLFVQPIIRIVFGEVRKHV